jgi:uncharacterized membrane-anchored protein YjiN (DUF445 family)
MQPPMPSPSTPSPSSPSPSSDDHLRRALARHRAFATTLLVVMCGLVYAAYQLPPSFQADLLAAAAKAGVVGGLADWFAVTALFRHPLGLPIPHTAIIPRQKERLGHGLGRFVANHVFTEAELKRVIARLDVAGILAAFLADRAASRPAAQALAAARAKAAGPAAAPGRGWPRGRPGGGARLAQPAGRWAAPGGV